MPAKKDEPVVEEQAPAEAVAPESEQPETQDPDSEPQEDQPAADAPDTGEGDAAATEAAQPQAPEPEAQAPDPEPSSFMVFYTVRYHSDGRMEEHPHVAANRADALGLVGAKIPEGAALVAHLTREA